MLTLNLNEAIDTIMTLVQDGDKDTPFVLSRQDGEWIVSYPQSTDSLPEAV